MRGELLLAAAIVLATGCPRNEPALPIIEEEEGPTELLSSVNVADPRAAGQLLSGFHSLEQRAWRWTEKRFTVVLQPPAAVAGHQTALTVRFTAPAVVIDQLGPVTLTASVDGETIGAQTFDKADEGLTFSLPVPEELLGSEPVEVVIEVDKAIPPSDLDGRELSVIVSSIGLE